MSKEPKEETKVEETKPKKIADLLPKDEDELDDAELLAKLTDKDGKLKVDTSLPVDFELEIMAQQVLENTTAYATTRQQWRSARNSGDNSKAQQLFKQMNYHQLTVAVLLAEFPKAKKIADEIGRARVKQAQQNRASLIAESD